MRMTWLLLAVVACSQASASALRSNIQFSREVDFLARSAVISKVGHRTLVEAMNWRSASCHPEVIKAATVSIIVVNRKNADSLEVDLSRLRVRVVSDELQRMGVEEYQIEFEYRTSDVSTKANDDFGTGVLVIFSCAPIPRPQPK